MMTNNRLWAYALAAATSICASPSQAPAAGTTANELSLRPRVAFVPAEVTIDGAPRPDIARAMTDSFTAASLKRGNYRVFNMDTQATAKGGRNGKARKNLGSLGAGVTGAVSGPKPADLDFLFTFNLVGDEGHYALTMKKLRAETNEVLEAHEFSTNGRLDRVFSMVPQALERVDARHLPPSFPVTQSPAYLHPPEPVAAYAATSPRPAAVPLEWKNFDFSKVPKALVYRQVGSIMATNTPWRFCIINPVGSPNVIHPHEDLQVLWDNSTNVYAKLRVSSFDSGKVIADFGRTPSYHRLFPGDSVFGWAPPVE